MESIIPDVEVTITIETLSVLPKVTRYNGLKVASPRSSRLLQKGLHHLEMLAVNHDKLRRRHAKKEILKRALTPPVRRPTLRWLDFRPTPSRLRNMSME
ncbi:hypothetical protein ACH5RR_028036 [Cinchona calisaya]|uniref:Uncharacterized protein n=1 Tax=Cinchona calisaya TaxID=153742 RepID=A0ABD2YR76_9GENT